MTGRAFVVVITSIAASAAACTRTQTQIAPFVPARDSTARSEPLGASDLRRQLVGRWTVEFVWDEKGRRSEGLLVLRDSLVRQQWFSGLSGELQMSIERELGFTPPCFSPSLGFIAVQVRRDTVDLDFSPLCQDNNLHVTGALHGDSVVGRWLVTRFAQSRADPGGTFRMWRIARPAP